MAYLGFRKGVKFSLATNSHTKGPNQVFQFFSYVKKKFWPKGHGPIPLNTPLQPALHSVNLVNYRVKTMVQTVPYSDSITHALHAMARIRQACYTLTVAQNAFSKHIY